MTLVKVNHPIGRTVDTLINDLFPDFPTAFGKAVREDSWNYPPVNIFEEPEAYRLELAVPGREKADFSLKLTNHLLTIQAEKKEPTSSENNKLVRREFGSRGFKRSFTLNEKVDSTNIQAKYENGVLYVILPKKEELKPASVDIAIQ